MVPFFVLRKYIGSENYDAEGGEDILFLSLKKLFLQFQKKSVSLHLENELLVINQTHNDIDR